MPVDRQRGSCGTRDDVLKHRQKAARTHLIKQATDLVVTRYLMHSEQALGIAPTLIPCHCPLIG
ncbi:MAG: hypothetical protein HC886_05895 [Leptolyngbyaceae cyanobacterium SM1_1_3]|nr:hypothetical protein [Leptolyngbyaceae cyanobacterium SM1_1_3]